MTEAVKAVVAAVTIGIVALVGLLLVGQLAGVATQAGTSSGSTQLTPTVNDTATLDATIDETPETFTPRVTTETGVALDGSGYVATDPPADWASGNWSVCAVGRLDDSVNGDAAHTLVAIDNETLRVDFYNGTWSVFYDEGARDARVSVPAARPSSLTPVCATHDNSTNTVSVVTAEGQQTSTLSSSPDARPVSYRWTGTVDEHRLWDQQLSSSAIDRYLAAPAAGIGVRDSARYMMDEGDGGTTSAYYHTDSAALVNATWTDGVQNPTLEAGVDYKQGVDPLSITPLAGGAIDESPVLYVSWGSALSGPMAGVIGGTAAAFELIPIVLLVLVAGAVVTIVRRLQTGV